jgi:LPXTG-motif cell wall-anchored protein
MKRILLPVAFAASTMFGAAGLAHAAGSGHGVTAYPPDTTTTLVANLPPVTAPPLTVPPAQPLPVTGSDSSSTLAIGAVALGVGGGLVLVARSRRRRPAPTA